MTLIPSSARWSHSAWVVLAAIFLPHQTETPPTLTIIPDAWSRRPRIIGYEYRTKDRGNMPTEGTGRPRAPRLPPGKGKYRVVGVVVENSGPETLEARLVSPQLRRGKRPRIEVPAGDRVRRFFPLKARPADVTIQFDLVGAGRATLAEASVPVSPSSRLGSRTEAYRIASELNRDERVRRRFRLHAVSVAVRDEEGEPVEGAALTLMHDETGWLETAMTDETGRWSGRLLAGPWSVLARKVFPVPPVDPRSTDVPPTRVLFLASRPSIEGPTEVALSAAVATPIIVENEEGAPLGLDRLWLAPRGFAGPLRFADVARSASRHFLLDVERKIGRGGVEVLGSPDLTYEIGAFRHPGLIPGVILLSSAEMSDDPIHMKMDPAGMGSLRLDPADALGSPGEIEMTVALPDRIRIELTVRARAETRLYLPPGPVRTRIAYSTPTGERIVLAPHLVTLEAKREVDLTPRLPITFQPYMVRSDGMQVWLSLQDRLGRIVESIQAQGKVRAAYKGELLFEGEISDLRYQFPTGMDDVEVSKVTFAATLKIGEKELEWRAAALGREKFLGERAEVVAPRVLADHARPYLEISRLSLIGSERVMGLPRSVKRISNQFDVFLPPDVGGLGGGGTIKLDLFDLIRFCAVSDPMPWAYRHEFGHNLGFGHDPYMMMAACGIDDEVFGPVGYRMKNGQSLSRVLAYLERPFPGSDRPWAPSGDAFAAIGLLYGPEIHKKMFEARRIAEGTLKQVGLSVIERIAVQYSLAAGDSLAWIFRAFDWPVFDERVVQGLNALRQTDLRKSGRIPKNIDGLTVRDWWLQGPLTLQAEDGAISPEVPWRYLAWREEFIALPDGPPERQSVGFRFFHRVQAASRVRALLVCGSDVQLDLMINGQTVSRINASPQMRQPKHDDYRLEERNQSVIPVVFDKGENFLEAVAIQPRGSKGFFLEIAGYDGKPVPGLRLRPAGPEDEDEGRARPKLLDPRPPIQNPSFEDGRRGAVPWTLGPVEPRNGVQLVWDTDAPARGKRCLLLRPQGPARGALIQRVILEPGSEYVLSGAIKAEGFAGKDCNAYICVFLQDPFDGHLARTDGPKAGSTRWRAYKSRFYSRKRRVAYVGCVVEGAGGAVWFDEVHLSRKD